MKRVGILKAIRLSVVALLALTGCGSREQPRLKTADPQWADVQRVLGMQLWKFKYNSKGASKVTYKVEEYESGRLIRTLAEGATLKPLDTGRVQEGFDPHEITILIGLQPTLSENMMSPKQMHVFLSVGSNGGISVTRNLIDNPLQRPGLQSQTFRIEENSSQSSFPLIGKLKEPGGKHEVSNCEWCLALRIEAEK